MTEIKQISLFVENRPGRTAKVAKTLSDAGVNIRALTIAEAGDFGVIRMVLDDPEKGYKVLKENAFTVSMTDVLAVEMKDTPGGLYEIVNTLGLNSVNVASGRHRQGETGAGREERQDRDERGDPGHLRAWINFIVIHFVQEVSQLHPSYQPALI